jgi:hypothetical protein
MIEKINWMLGMTENMMNISIKNMEKTMVPEMYAMTSAMMGNLNQMKIYGSMDERSLDMMEQMMRNMEMMMLSMDLMNEKQKTVMKHMMGYMVLMQMNMIIGMIEQK